MVAHVLVTGRTDPKFHLLGLHGSHCRRPNLPSNQGYSESRFHASYEDQLDHFTVGIGICPEVFA